MLSLNLRIAGSRRFFPMIALLGMYDVKVLEKMLIYK